MSTLSKNEIIILLDRILTNKELDLLALTTLLKGIDLSLVVEKSTISDKVWRNILEPSPVLDSQNNAYCLIDAKLQKTLSLINPITTCMEVNLSKLLQLCSIHKIAQINFICSAEKIIPMPLVLIQQINEYPLAQIKVKNKTGEFFFFPNNNEYILPQILTDLNSSLTTSNKEALLAHLPYYPDIKSMYLLQIKTQEEQINQMLVALYDNIWKTNSEKMNITKNIYEGYYKCFQHSNLIVQLMPRNPKIISWLADFAPIWVNDLTIF